MASSKIGTSTSNTSGGEYQVFLSFRGPDTRHGFTNCLYHALVAVGIHVFMDDEELRPGERLSNSLLRAIDDSKLCIPLFSKKYASSHWCLRELAKMVENSKSNANGKVILPIFYDVEPSDVKLKTTLYSKAISDLAEEIKDQKKKFSSKDVETWRQALKEVSDIKGFKLEDYSRNYGDLIKVVVDEVLDRLQTRERQVPKNLVGMEDCIVAIDKLLDIDSEDVRLIVIYGMGGIGKTTLANVIFNKLCHRFGKNCSFLGDVRKMAKKKKGLLKLQKKLLSDISYFKVDRKIKNTYNGMQRIGETICSKKMLIVLDDVDEGTQIENLIGANSLYRGTRILVTTRDKSVLNIKEFKYIWKNYEMVGLSNADALRLFSRHAFNDDSPPADYYNLSKGIVHTAGGLPLALEVIGSYLSKKEKEIWEEWLEMLKKTSHKDVLSKLRISYDALDWNEQQIFLDIACFFVGQNKTNPMYVWQDCNFRSKEAIDVLTQRCMIKVLADDRFWMHDDMRDLGRAIAKETNTRLWDTNDIICNLRSTKIEKIEALHFSASRDVTSEQIKRFPHLRILWLRKVICRGDFTDCLSELRWINLRYPYGTIRQVRLGQRLQATNLLHLQNAVVVNLSGIEITKDVLDCLIKGGRKLKVLTIEYNTLISETPTFPECSNLQKLKFCRFYSLMEIDCSIGKLRWLSDLSFENCWQLKKLPEQIGELQNLRHLCLDGCHHLIKLPNLVLKLKLLTKLDVSRTEITRLPDTIGELPNSSSIDVHCTPITEMPNTMSKFCQLQTLDLNRCHEIQELPKLPISLTTLRLESTSLLTIPNLSYLTNLVELVLYDGFEFRDTSNVIRTRDLWWIGMLSKLRKLHLCFPNVCAPTTQLYSLSLLEELTVYGIDLPAFKQLRTNLIVLDLYETRREPSTPRWASSIGKGDSFSFFLVTEKETLFLSTSLGKSRKNKVYEQHDVQFPDVLESSERSRIQDCRSSERSVCLLEEPGCNEPQAAELIIHRREAFLFPVSLKMLEKFLLWGFSEVQDIQVVSMLESLEEFSVEKCSSLKRLGGLSNLKNLKRLTIFQCPSLKVVEGTDELEFLHSLEISGCRLVERIVDASRSKIPNECSIRITRSGELPDYGCTSDTWESYKVKIFYGTKQASDFETEATDSETEMEDSLKKTGQENKEKKRKRKTESAKQQGRKRRKLREKVWVRLFRPIISLCRTRKMKNRKERAGQLAKEQGKE